MAINKSDSKQSLQALPVTNDKIEVKDSEPADPKVEEKSAEGGGTFLLPGDDEDKAEEEAVSKPLDVDVEAPKAEEYEYYDEEEEVNESAHPSSKKEVKEMNKGTSKTVSKEITKNSSK